MKVKFIEVKDPKGKIIAKAEVPSRTNKFISYFVLKHKDGHYSCNCGRAIFGTVVLDKKGNKVLDKNGRVLRDHNCNHIRFAKGEIKTLED